MMHDWTLTAFEYSWKNKRLVVSVRYRQQVHDLLFEQVSDVHIVQRAPWGPSASINDVSVLVLDQATQRTSIEVQSGDTIEIVSATFELEEWIATRVRAER